MNKQHQQVKDLIEEMGLTEKDIRDMMGGSTRVHALRDRVRLVRIVASRFSNTATDRSVRDEVAADKRVAAKEQLSVTKRILDKSVMKQVSTPYHAARDLLRTAKNVDENGMPLNNLNTGFGLGKWDSAWTMVSIGRLPDLITAFEAERAEQGAALRELEPQWRELVQEVENNLGDLFDSDLVPSYESFANAWGMEMEIVELPQFDPRVNMDAIQRGDFAQQVQKHTADRLTEKLTTAWKDGATTLLNSLNYVTAVLGNDPSTVSKMNGSSTARKSKRAVAIQDSMLDNLRTQVAMVKDLAESAQDKTLLALAHEAEATVCKLDAEHLRTNPADRSNAASMAKRLADAAAVQVANTQIEVKDALDELEDFA